MTELGIMGYTKAMSAMDTVMDSIGGSKLFGELSIKDFLDKLTSKGQSYGKLFLIFMGVIALVFAVFKTVTNLMSKQGATTSWGVIAVLYVVGLLCIGGSFIMTLFKSGGSTTNDLNLN